MHWGPCQEDSIGLGASLVVVEIRMRLSWIALSCWYRFILLVWLVVKSVGLGNIENTTLQLLQQSHCNYCHNTAINRAQHHYTCVPLESATASFSIGMNQWVSIVVVSTYLIDTLHCSIMMCITWQYSATYYIMLLYSVIHCTCDIIEMWKCLQYWYCRS